MPQYSTVLFTMLDTTVLPYTITISVTVPGTGILELFIFSQTFLGPLDKKKKKIYTAVRPFLDLGFSQWFCCTDLFFCFPSDYAFL